MRKMGKHCRVYNGVTHCNFESEFCSVHTQNCNFGDSLTYLNTVFTP